MLVVVSGSADGRRSRSACWPRWLPVAALGRRAAQRRLSLVTAWPDAVDDLASAVRAGLSLPDAVGALAERGPEVLRPPFGRFAADHRVTGAFGTCLDRLKDDLADPVGDRVVEALRLARDVGGTELGRLLRTLSAVLREDARTRAELLGAAELGGQRRAARRRRAVGHARVPVAAPGGARGVRLRRGSRRAADRRPGPAPRPTCSCAARASARSTSGCWHEHRSARCVGRPRQRRAVLIATSGARPGVRRRIGDRIAPYLDGPSSSHRSRATTPACGSTPRTLERLVGPVAARARPRGCTRCSAAASCSTQRLARRGRYGATAESLPPRAGDVGRPVRSPRSAAVVCGAHGGRTSGPAGRRPGPRGRPRHSPPCCCATGGCRRAADAAARGDPRRAARRRRPPRARRRERASRRRPLSTASRASPTVRSPTSAGARAPTPRAASRSSTRSTRWRRGSTSPPYADSSTASRSPCSEARRSPTCCARRPATRAPTCTACCSRSPASKELLMLVPVVFLVLPTVVLVALFPAVSSLSRPRPRDAPASHHPSRRTPCHCAPSGSDRRLTDAVAAAPRRRPRRRARLGPRRRHDRRSRHRALARRRRPAHRVLQRALTSVTQAVAMPAARIGQPTTDGSAVVEFVVVVPLLVLLLLAVVQVGLALHVRVDARVGRGRGCSRRGGRRRRRCRRRTPHARGARLVARRRRRRVRHGARRRTVGGVASIERGDPRTAAPRGSPRPDRAGGAGLMRSRRAVTTARPCSRCIALGVGLLVPLLYAVVSVMTVQSATYAATSAARESARAYVTAATPAQGARAGACGDAPRARRRRRRRASRRRCAASAAASCPGRGSTSTVQVDVPLPLLPGGPDRSRSPGASRCPSTATGRRHDPPRAPRRPRLGAAARHRRGGGRDDARHRGHRRERAVARAPIGAGDRRRRGARRRAGRRPPHAVRRGRRRRPRARPPRRAGGGARLRPRAADRPAAVGLPHRVGERDHDDGLGAGAGDRPAAVPVVPHRAGVPVAEATARNSAV